MHFLPSTRTSSDHINASDRKLLNDSQVYPNPFTFDPTRYLGPNPQPDPREIAFGFGRRCVTFVGSMHTLILINVCRICPGRVLADEMVFLSCAQSLAVFEITKAVENGIPVEPVHGQGSGVIRCVSCPVQSITSLSYRRVFSRGAATPNRSSVISS